MNYIESVLAELNQTKEEYIKQCKECFLKEPKPIQKEIEEAPTWKLESELKTHKWIIADWCQNYCKAISYELMLRNDFEVKI